MFSEPTIPVTQEVTKLCVAKLQAKQHSNDLATPMNVPVIFFILALFQKQFYIFIGIFHVSGMA
jgi:hypothetical protein